MRIFHCTVWLLLNSIQQNLNRVVLVAYFLNFHEVDRINDLSHVEQIATSFVSDANANTRDTTMSG
jgi:hypothetical protein